jgi:rhamnose transport system ATP-binding protein
MVTPSDSAPVLEMRDIAKRFDATQALSGVSMQLYPGEVHAVIGENGAGKSTLIKIMTGVHRPDTGEILLDGKPVQVRNSQEAQALGIAAIYQEPMVYPDLNVAENIFISHADRGPVVRWGKMYEDAREILAQLDVRLDVKMPARGLTLAAQQAVEIAKAISLKVRVLIMDEPTASLSQHEVTQLFKLVRSLCREGVAILFIGHRLEEVFTIADRITVLRDGKWISTRARAEVTRDAVIRDMVGRDVNDFFSKGESKRGELLASVRNLGKEGVFSGVSFDVYCGEVLGFAGLIGSHRTDVALALFGIEPADTGEITFEGKTVKIESPEDALRLGIAYASEDRRQLGLIMPMSIVSNISLPMLKNYLNPIGLIRRRKEVATAEKFRQRLAIRAPSVHSDVARLSGGNQQKVMLSKWLNAEPKLLILDEPTRGIDVGAKAEVHHMISDLAEQGIAVIMISSDLPEVLGMSDRVLVMREGRQMAVLDRAEATEQSVMAAAMGTLSQGLPQAQQEERKAAQ